MISLLPGGVGFPERNSSRVYTHQKLMAVRSHEQHTIVLQPLKWNYGLPETLSPPYFIFHVGTISHSATSRGAGGRGSGVGGRVGDSQSRLPTTPPLSSPLVRDLSPSPPLLSGRSPRSILLHFSASSEIIEVSEEHAYAIVEPGVSFFDLYNYIQEKGYRLWPSCPTLGWGSVSGNTLERGFDYTPNGEHAEQQCGMGCLVLR